MTILHEARLSDSPYVDLVTRGQTIDAGFSIRPAECSWHMVLRRLPGKVDLLVVGPHTSAGEVTWGAGAELLWIRFKIGTFMPHLPVKNFMGMEIALPDASSNSFWLNGSAWQFPDYENADTFVNQLVREGVLLADPIVNAALQDQSAIIPSRTVRHRFLHSTGLSQAHIRQTERAQYAATLLEQGVSILDTVYEAGYFDQPHLTKSLKRFIGKTPAQILVEIQQPDPNLQQA